MITVVKKLRKAKPTSHNWEKRLLLSSLEIVIYELRRKELWDYRFWKINKMVARKRADLSSQSRHGSSARSIFSRYKYHLRYLALHNIQHQEIKAPWSGLDAKPRLSFFSNEQLMNMHEICPNLLPVRFKMTTFGLEIHVLT